MLRPRSLRALLLAVLAGLVMLAPAAPLTTPAVAGPDRVTLIRPEAGRPIVIGHRGASGYRPEHTLASYALAVELGADYIEPDLVSTKDGVLVARHENEIGGTTDVADHPEFAGRRTTKTIDGTAVTGWFTEDFTLAELKRLRAEERIPALRQRNTLYDGRYQVPTLDEILALQVTLSRRYHRVIGVYPETKHPTYFRSLGLPLEDGLVTALRRRGLDRSNAPVYVQSFEVGNLRALRHRLRVPLIQLIDGSGAPYDLRAAGDPRTYTDLLTPAGLAEIATYADGIGPAKDRIVPRDASGRLLAPTPVVRDAHREGLLVHPFTFRNENQFLPLDFRRGADPAAYGNAFAEYQLFFEAGVDGVFSDNGDTALEARDAWVAARSHRAA
ncbi:MAG: glycerophosphoryl diester phosphodiesterase [Actinomycetota bacterium]|nr:glycerophosphoryl diester phosphodiesterase [Actinomycetota bacterium]